MARMFIFGVVKIWRLFADEQSSSSPAAMNQTLESGKRADREREGETWKTEGEKRAQNE